MSEKRFVLDYEDDDTIFIDDNKLKKHLTIRNVKIKMGDLNDIVDRLNQLDEENEELLKKEKHLHKVITRKDGRINNLVRNKEQLKEENEQLKNYQKRAECSNFQINKLKEEIAELQEDNVDTIVELSKENEQLRQTMQKVYKLLEEEVDDI